MPALRGSFFPLSCSVLAAPACLPPFSVRHVLPALCMLPAVTHAPPLSGFFFGLPPVCLWLLPPFRMFPAVTRTFPFSFSSVSRHVLPAFRIFPAVIRTFFFFPLLLFTAMFLSLRSFFISAVSAPVSPSFFGATKKSPEKALRSYFFLFFRRYYFTTKHRPYTGQLCDITRHVTAAGAGPPRRAEAPRIRAIQAAMK